MAVDATGTPTSPDSIPTYNTAVDAPSGKGFNAAMAAIQTALSSRAGSPAGIISGEAPIWNGSVWVRSSVTGLTPSGIAGYPANAAKGLRGDGTWAGEANLIWDSVDAGVSLPVASITTPTLPTTYKHLMVKYSLRSDVANFLQDLQVQLGIAGGAIDTTTNYNTQRIFTAGATAPSGTDNVNVANWFAGIVNGTSADGNSNGQGEFTIISSSLASNRVGFTGMSIGQVGSTGVTGGNRITLHSGMFKNTPGAVTSIKFFMAGGNFASGRISVYGIG
jgi:hypothetical protein